MSDDAKVALLFLACWASIIPWATLMCRLCNGDWGPWPGWYRKLRRSLAKGEA